MAFLKEFFGLQQKFPAAKKLMQPTTSKQPQPKKGGRKILDLCFQQDVFEGFHEKKKPVAIPGESV